MDQKEFLLSVCVPTYNQAEAVKKLLENLVLQYTPQIEIVVCDDSTNNDTEEIVVEFQKIIPVRYFHRKREGLDRAVIFLTEEARGLFVWWIGDDVIGPDSIRRILTLISQNMDLSFIWVNSSDITNKNALTVSDTRNHFFKDRNEILKLDIGLLGFITATIFKRDVAVPGLTEAEKYIGSAFVCMYIILFVISREGRHYFLGTPSFHSNPKPPGEVRWYDQFQVFGINLFHVVKNFQGYFDRHLIKKALSKNLKMVLKAIVVERALGLKTGFASSSQKVIPLAKIYWNYPEFYLVLPLLLLPRPLLSFFYVYYKRVMGSQR